MRTSLLDRVLAGEVAWDLQHASQEPSHDRATHLSKS